MRVKIALIIAFLVVCVLAVVALSIATEKSRRVETAVLQENFAELESRVTNSQKIEIPKKLEKIVKIRAQRVDESVETFVVEEEASGIAVGGGRVLTVGHAFSGTAVGEVAVVVSGENLGVSRVVLHPTLDLAALKIEDNSQNLEKIAKKFPEILDEVVVAGFPLGFQNSVTKKLRVASEPKIFGEISQDFPVVALDGVVAGGMSGSPVRNSAGELVGLVVAVSESRGLTRVLPVVGLDLNFENFVDFVVLNLPGQRENVAGQRQLVAGGGADFLTGDVLVSLDGVAVGETPLPWLLATRGLASGVELGLSRNGNFVRVVREK